MLLADSLTSPAAADFGAWMICAVAVLMGLDRLASLLSWLKAYAKQEPAKPDTENDTTTRLTKIEAKLDNGIATNLSWLCRQVTQHGEALVSVQQDLARQAGILDEWRRSQHQTKAR